VGGTQGARSGEKAVEHLSVNIEAEFFLVSLVTLGLVGFPADRLFRWNIDVSDRICVRRRGRRSVAAPKLFVKCSAVSRGVGP
jgi:hypothetical protein